MQTITRDEFKMILEARQGEEEVVMVTSTMPAMRKTNNPFMGRVRKVSRVVGFINWHYAGEVNEQREKEGGFEVVEGGGVRAKEVEQFVAKPRKWGERLPNSPFVHHKGKYYLELKVSESVGHDYYLDGEKLDTDSDQLAAIKAFFSKKSSASRQGVANMVILRDYALASISAIEIDPKKAKIKYLVTDEVRQQEMAA